MVVSFLRRTLTTKTNLTSNFSRSLTPVLSPASSVSSQLPPFLRSFSPLFHFQPLVSLTEFPSFPSEVGSRCFSSPPETSILNDPSPNCNIPPGELKSYVQPGCDFKHWLIHMEKPKGKPTRDEIIDSYIKTLALVLGSEEAARKSIYSVSTRHYFAFGCLVSEELADKIRELPKVFECYPDSYMDVENEDYGGEPFIDGKAVPYDPKYHEVWVKNGEKRRERKLLRKKNRVRENERATDGIGENMENGDLNQLQNPTSNAGENMENGDSYQPQNPTSNAGESKTDEIGENMENGDFDQPINLTSNAGEVKTDGTRENMENGGFDQPRNLTSNAGEAKYGSQKPTKFIYITLQGEQLVFRYDDDYEGLRFEPGPDPSTLILRQPPREDTVWINLEGKPSPGKSVTMEQAFQGDFSDYDFSSSEEEEEDDDDVLDDTNCGEPIAVKDKEEEEEEEDPSLEKNAATPETELCSGEK